MRRRKEQEASTGPTALHLGAGSSCPRCDTYTQGNRRKNQLMGGEYRPKQPRDHNNRRVNQATHDTPTRGIYESTCCRNAVRSAVYMCVPTAVQKCTVHVQQCACQVREDIQQHGPRRCSSTAVYVCARIYTCKTTCTPTALPTHLERRRADARRHSRRRLYALTQ